MGPQRHPYRQQNRDRTAACALCHKHHRCRRLIRDSGHGTFAMPTVTLPKREAHRAAGVIILDESSKKKSLEGKPGGTESNRRRVGMVVHDDRGNASVEWHDAPAGEERPVLEILGNPVLSIQNDNESFDPYARHTAS